MFDVYLAGVSDRAWREQFKSAISSDIGVFDSYVDNYDNLTDAEKVEQYAKEMTYIERCGVIAFYFNPQWEGVRSLIELGEVVAHGKQVFVCLDGSVFSADKIKLYCEFKGIPVVNSIDELVAAVEECLAQTELCNFQ